MRPFIVIRAQARIVLPRLLALLVAVLLPAAAMAQARDVQTAWRLLDYVAVDYGGAVADGRIKSASEYAEMNEFAASVTARLQTLPPKPERQTLLEGAAKLQSMIARKPALRCSIKPARPATGRQAMGTAPTRPSSPRRRSRLRTWHARASAACSRFIRR